MRAVSYPLLLALIVLSGCASPEAARPDQRIGVLHDPATGRDLAIPRPCPDWTYHAGAGLENHFPPHFGCADAYNLGHMIDRPSDLVHGREAGAADAAPGVLGIERYRTGKTKKLMNPKESSATTKN